MAKCFSFTATRDTCYRCSFETTGLKSVTKELGEGTTMHCWAPKKHRPTKPTIVLLHGFGANAMWQWDYYITRFISKFNVYVPDLVFFGDSFTTRPDRTESFQAQCVMKMMEDGFGVATPMSIAGVSYGGFVAYSMAAQFPEKVEKVVLICAGVCLEDKDMEDGLFKVANLDDAAELLIPESPEKLRELMKLSFYKYKPRDRIPSCFLADYIQVMCAEYREEKKQLIEALQKDRKLANLPKISQPTLIIWGENDQVFPLELAHRLKRHIGETAQLVIIKKAGHAINIEKPKRLCKLMKSFFMDQPLPQSASNGNDKSNVN